MALRRRGSERDTGELVRQVFDPYCSTGVRNVSYAVTNFIAGINILLRESPNYRLTYDAFKTTDGFDNAFPDGYEHIGSVANYRWADGPGHVVGYVKIDKAWFLADNESGVLIPRTGPICRENQYVDARSGTLIIDPRARLESVTHIHASTKVVEGNPVYPVAGRAIASQQGVTCGPDSLHNVLFIGNRARRIFTDEVMKKTVYKSPATTDYRTLYDRLIQAFSSSEQAVPSKYSELMKALTLMISRQASINNVPPTLLPPTLIDRTCTMRPTAGTRRKSLRHRGRRLLKVRTNRRKHRE